MGLMLGHPKIVDAGFQALNSGTVRFAWSFRAPKTGNLARAGFRFTAAVTPQTMKASWQDPQATTLRPDETVDQFRTFTPAVGWITTGLITSDGTDSGALRAVTKGARVCLVIEWDSTTGSVQLQPYGTTNEHWKPNTWNFTRSSGGAWNAAAGLATTNFAVQYDDGTWAYVDGALPCSADGTHSFNSGSTPDEIGLRFLAPFTGAVLKGVHARMDAAATFDVKLYDENTTLLASTTFTSGERALGSTAQVYFELPEVELTGGHVYRVTFVPSSGSNIGLPYADVSANAILGAWPGGIECYQTHRANAGAWTDTTTRRPNMNLIWSDDIPPPTSEVTFSPDDLTPVGLVWVEAFLPT
ncbi:MAG: hypothetical protein AB7S57_19545 [Acetobacteraceae bacterium]